MTGRGPEGWDVVVGAASEEVAGIARRAREVVRGVMPDAVEEVDEGARLLGFTFAPGTYKGLVVGLVLHARHVNLMFAEGAALDGGGLLEGTGKKARHIKLRAAEDAADPRIAALLAEAAARVRDRLAAG
ncbi:hypothetical protein SSPIM334S_02740 [Streptomyces spiroverticillatus]|nr:DUF1801 domain-containing protein [Streptomyces finlayi]